MARDLQALLKNISQIRMIRTSGHVTSVGWNSVEVSGLTRAKLGDRVEIIRGATSGEIIALSGERATVLPEAGTQGLSAGDVVDMLGPVTIAPSDGWIGRVIDPLARPLDGRPLESGPHSRRLDSPPPPPAARRSFGARLSTGLAAFDTLLPIVAGQRIGLFSGSGVGKSTLLGQLARGLHADVVVVALVGERGRELGEFIDKVMGAEGMARAVIVAATSDQSPLMRRRCLPTAMTIAEHFRDQGKHVLLLVDSVTRFAEAHREIALSAGEPPSLRGYPPSTAHTLMALCERAGTGAGAMGDITAVLSVLVAGSDMEGPVADIIRGTLDGHVVLSRPIAERGRYPALDLLRSVSRSLPGAASDEENQIISDARRLLSAYDQAEMMIQAGLYVQGQDAHLDRAIRLFPALDGFLAETAPTGGPHSSFSRLKGLLRERAF